ncbi:MAG TPA: tRNA lysidine(34) synthetase TilS [Spirochaetota bacterium]|nr:tRNA lysidine(34) synthetase TilS [Spirochaetota bacterium]HPI89970.1 tRNA lysidine(34) synthetase TilS [Spirochaetota bacterium]HPR48405.1 tRNA lysidine(34) synthetase TilS [Spirochaetota bacterium]
MHQLITTTLDYIERHALISRGDRIILSLSAGKDSMALLHVLLALRERLGVDLGIFHVNHLMRGEESDADEEFLKETAARLDIPCFMDRYDFKRNRAAGLSFEEQAREKRYALMKELMEREGYTRAAMGHSRNDNIETILMRIFTGTGVYGLRGIRPERDEIIRPLLHCGSDEIYAFLRDENIPWREDRSNSRNEYSRNFIRNEIIPQIRERFPMLFTSIENLSEIAVGYESLLETLLTPLLAQNIRWENGALIIPEKTINTEPPLFNFALSSLSRKYFGFTPGFSTLNEINSKRKSGRSHIELYSAGSFSISRKFLEGEPCIVFSPFKTDIPSEWSYALNLNEGGEIELAIPEINAIIKARPVDHNFFINNKHKSNYIFLGLTHDIRPLTITIRNRRKGDRIKLSHGSKKLKDLYIEKKLDSCQKMSIPLCIVNSEVAAVMPGAVNAGANRVSADFLVTGESKKVLALYYSYQEMY